MQNNVYRLYSLEVKSTNKNRYISDRNMQKCIYNRFMSIDRESTKSSNKMYMTKHMHKKCI